MILGQYGQLGLYGEEISNLVNTLGQYKPLGVHGESNTIVMVLNAPALTCNFIAAEVNHDRLLITESAQFESNLQTHNVEYDRAIGLNTASLESLYSEIDSRYDRYLQIPTANFVVSGISFNLQYDAVGTFVMSLEAGRVQSSVTTANLVYDRFSSVTAFATYISSGIMYVNFDRLMQIEVGQIALSAVGIDTLYNRVLSMEQGQYEKFGNSANLIYSGFVRTAVTGYTVRFQACPLKNIEFAIL